MDLKYPKHHVSLPICALLAHAWFHFVYRLSRWTRWPHSARLIPSDVGGSAGERWSFQVLEACLFHIFIVNAA